MSSSYWPFSDHINAFPRDVARRLFDVEPCWHHCHCHQAQDAEPFLAACRHEFEMLTADERTEFARKWLDAELMQGEWSEQTGLPPFFAADEVPRVEPSEEVLAQVTPDDLGALEQPWGPWADR